ncbi:uncharacterized protein EV422DRAFT_570783 [Fimicolochytrium jonesii]|uniref:uncharacterized protein n=1 Tax=Fimicolochytrium jonesii TaxID=1396493 RepID=UPI0022FEFAC2|nr:uncharacterized protein EV422DRAFT_570783 [Fimicolochytrium jonesii]KAI8817439.1 hypothetical protein EV422DRAFT_570783 [Fimicolochytrium jonesii]
MSDTQVPGRPPPQPSMALFQSCVVGYMTQNPTGGLPEALEFCSTSLSTWGGEMAAFTIHESGPAAIIIGITYPIIILDLVLSASRLRKMVNGRGVTMLFASLANLVFASAIAFACTGVRDPATIRVTDNLGLTGFIFMLFSTCLTGVYRASNVILIPHRQQLFRTTATVCIAIFGIGFAYNAYTEVKNSPVYPTEFSYLFFGLTFVPVLTYIIGGCVSFSWNIPQTTFVTAGGQRGSVLRALKRLNDIMTALTICIAISQLAILYPLRKSATINSVSCLHVSLMLLLENMFESAIIVLAIFGAAPVNAAASSHREQLSGANTSRTGFNTSARALTNAEKADGVVRSVSVRAPSSDVLAMGPKQAEEGGGGNGNARPLFKKAGSQARVDVAE